MNNNQIKGVIPIVMTPLTNNGDIDHLSCKKLVNYLIDNGASALFIFGSAGEGFLLDIDQRVEAVQAVSEANKGRIPIIAGCAYMAPRMVFEFFRRVENEKLHGFHYIPEDLKIGEERLVFLLNSYADAAPFPIYLYHNIKRGRALTTEIVSQVKKHPKISGMKVGGYDRNEMKSFLELGDDDFQVIGSGGGQFLDWLELGATAVTASSSCCFPKLFNEIYSAYMSGNIEAAKKNQQKWIDFHSEIPNTAPDNGEYAAEEKYILKKIGILEHDYCHFPYRQLTAQEEFKTDKALAKYF